MKVFILSADLSGDGPVWMNIFWPHFTAYSDSVPTVVMSTPHQTPSESRIGARWQDWWEQREHGDRLCEQVRSELDPDGPNILLVWALNTRDIARSRLLEPVWDMFDARVLWILDTVHPADTRLQTVQEFDMLASICGDIGRDFEAATGLPVVYMPPHTDVLRYGTTSPFRPLDLLVVGRRDADIYTPVHLHFSARDKQRFSADIVTRTKNFSGTTEQECQVLMAAYSRAKVSFCFEPSKADPRFHGYSPLTERWPHSWASGCTVVGTRPTGLHTDTQMDWPDATIELPDNPDDAIAFLEGLLDDTEGLQQRRSRNVAEAARRHDSRRRLYTLLSELDLPIPAGLTEGLARLDTLADNLLREAA